MRVFCLEDNALVVMHLEAVIEDCGYEMVGTAGSFEDARRQWDETDFDLALIDIDLMDGATGIEAARHVRQSGRRACFVTGQADLAEANRDLVMAVVNKPLDEARLRRVLSDAKASLRVPTAG